MRCKLQLSEHDKTILNNIINSDKATKRSKQKSMIILLKSEGKSIKYITENLKISKRTVINYTNKWKTLKFNFIHGQHYRKSELEKYTNEIKNDFSNNIAESYQEASDRIYNLYGIRRSIPQIRAYFIKHNLYTIQTNKNNPNYNYRRKNETKIKNIHMKKTNCNN